MPSARRRLLCGNDSGAITVLTAIVAMLVLLPVAALGVTSYSRTAVRDEMLRAAESGALAGAATVPLADVDLGAVTKVLDPLLTLPNDADPLTAACVAAFKALDKDGLLSKELAGPVAGASGTPRCTASYAQPVLPRCVDPITDLVDILTLGTLQGSELGRGVLDLLPALRDAAVTVTLEHTVRGPLDALLGPAAQAPTAAEVSATARRVFEPLLPNLPVLGPVEKLVTDLLDLVLAVLKAVLSSNPVNAVLSLVDQAVSVVKDLLLYTLGPLLGAVAGAALAPVHSLLLQPVLGALSLLGSGANGQTGIVGPCVGVVTELLDDLDHALEVNEASDRQSLIPCVLTELTRIGTLNNLVDGTVNTCTNQLWRARLVSGA